jgi:hypothetical protein
MPHLMFLKEVTDQGRLQYDHPLGLCLVAAGRGNTIPLKEILDQSEPTWLQWRRRLDPMQPFCRIAGHTSEEILAHPRHPGNGLSAPFATTQPPSVDEFDV